MPDVPDGVLRSAATAVPLTVYDTDRPPEGAAADRLTGTVTVRLPAASVA